MPASNNEPVPALVSSSLRRPGPRPHIGRPPAVLTRIPSPRPSSSSSSKRDFFLGAGLKVWFKFMISEVQGLGFRV